MIRSSQLIVLLVGMLLALPSSFADPGSNARIQVAELTPQQRAKLRKKPKPPHTRPGHAHPGQQPESSGQSDSGGSDNDSSAGTSGPDSSSTSKPNRPKDPPKAPPPPPVGGIPPKKLPTNIDQISPGSTALMRYKGPLYRPMNALMRGTATAKVDNDGNLTVGDKSLDRPLQDVQADLKAMGALMRELPPHAGKTVYRAVDLDADALETLRKKLGRENDDWEDGGFMSTATAESPKDWVRKDTTFAPRGNVVIEVDLRPAAGKHGGVDLDQGPMKNMVGQSLENEVLFPPGQRFRVVEMVSGNEVVKEKLGVGANDAMKATTYVRMEALAYTKADAERFNQRVDQLGKTVQTSKPAEPFVPATPPTGPRR